MSRGCCGENDEKRGLSFINFHLEIHQLLFSIYFLRQFDKVTTPKEEGTLKFLSFTP
jgi:hypothetical protein